MCITNVCVCVSYNNSKTDEMMEAFGQQRSRRHGMTPEQLAQKVPTMSYFLSSVAVISGRTFAGLDGEFMPIGLITTRLCLPNTFEYGVCQLNFRNSGELNVYN